MGPSPLRCLVQLLLVERDEGVGLVQRKGLELAEVAERVEVGGLELFEVGESR